MLKRLLVSAATIALLAGPAKADSNLFLGNSFYATANPFGQDGAAGFFKMSLASDGTWGSSTLVSNYYRTLVIYITTDIPGTFRLNVALSDWNGAFNAYQDYLNPTYGNRVIAYTDPIPWLGIGNKQFVSAQWDMDTRSVWFQLNEEYINTNIALSTGPNASFQVNYSQSVLWQFGADSQTVMLYGQNLHQTYLGANGYVASDQMQFHPWGYGSAQNPYGWDYGPSVYTF